jgi:ATP-dependent Clp protease ATP-binding subunit ClpC
MFERFTDEARRSIVVAQEEARAREHNSIGTEHFLLALIADEDGRAARVLVSSGIPLDSARAGIERHLRPAEGPVVSGHIPFTPYAKKTLELSLLESAELGHPYIGSEHLLLGLIGAHGGLAERALHELGADPGRLRQEVARLVTELGPAHGGLPGRVGSTDHESHLLDTALEALVACWEGDLELLQQRLADAARVAAQAGDTERLAVLARVVEIDDAATGAIRRLRPRPG